MATTTILKLLLFCNLLPHITGGFPNPFRRNRPNARNPATPIRQESNRQQDGYIHCTLTEDKIKENTGHRYFFNSELISKSARKNLNYGHMAVVNVECSHRAENEKPIEKTDLQMGQNVMVACKSGVKPPKNVLIGYFDKSNADLQHSGVFLGCDDTHFTIADQYHGKKFGVRDIEYEDGRCKRREASHFCGKNFYFVSLKNDI